MSFKEVLEFNFINFSHFHLNLLQVIIFIFIIFIARIFLGLLARIIKRFFTRKGVDTGRQYALIQVLKYVIYTGAVLMALESVGITLSLIWGGAAALMVGLGLGLQQTFNDLVSGIILLVEGTVEVDDVLEVEGIVGTVTSIGIRTSKLETRDRISLIIPNSKLVGEKATNWSHNNTPTRFYINVGVAYGSDVDLVTKLVLQAAKEHSMVLDTPAPAVMFKDFGNSSLDFLLLIFSLDYLRIEFVKSELRYRIFHLFREHNVEIPFPQRDLWIRNAKEIPTSESIEPKQ